MFSINVLNLKGKTFPFHRGANRLTQEVIGLGEDTLSSTLLPKKCIWICLGSLSTPGDLSGKEVTTRTCH